MADDKVDEDSAQTGGEGEDEAPKKTFGILAARFLQKGKSSPGSITGEFEALQPPNATPTADSNVRKIHPIDDEDEELIEGSIHGMEVPLSESLYADIGLDDMSAFGDSESDSSSSYSGLGGATYGESTEASAPDVVYDIDAGEQPVISFGSGSASDTVHEIEADHEEQSIHSEEQEQPDYQAVASEPEYQYGTEETAETEAVPEYHYGTEEVAEAIEPAEPVEHQYAAETIEAAEVVAQSDYSESTYIETAPEIEHQPADEVAEEQPQEQDLEPAAYEPEPIYQPESIVEPEPVYEPDSELEPAAELKAAFDVSALDSIGAKEEFQPAAFDKGALDQIGADSEVNDKIFVSKDSPPAAEKKGLLGKFAAKKEPAVRPLIGGAKKDTPEPTVVKPDTAALDSIGTKGFDASSLDSIGTKGFDAGSLDSIGTKGFDASALDQIGEPSAPPAESKEKPAKGGLLGGKFGQKAKILGSEKSKLGAIIPPSVDPTFDQKETGRFMVNAPESAESMGAAESLTSAPAEDFTAPTEDYSAPTEDFSAPVDDAAAPAKEALSASFFDESKETFVEEENIPVIGSDEIGRLITDADNAYRMRQFKAAEPIFASVLEKLDKVGDDTDPLLPYCLDKMADNLFQMKKYKESLQFFRRLLVLHTKVSSADREMISTLYKIAQTSEALNLTSEADSMYKRAFRLGQQSLVPGDPLLAKVLEGYGTMLMRSEGAEPPAAVGTVEKTAEETTAEKASALSAEEIAMLNSLGAASDRAADRSSSEPSPIILSGGPTDQSSSKSRTPLRESDERADKVRAAGGPSGASSAGGFWVRLGILLTVIASMVLVVLNIKTDYTAHHIQNSKDFAKRVYKSVDGLSQFTITSENQATKDNFGKHFSYEYVDWNGTPSDDIEVISGKIGADNFIYEVPQGIKDGSGFIFFDPHAPEVTVAAKMHELAAKAQAVYKAKGKYPEGKELEKLGKSLGYKSPFGEATDSVAVNTMAWPANLDASQIFIKSRFDASLEDGNSWDGEAGAKPGQISAAAASQKSPDSSVFYVHGRDRNGALLTRADGKAFVLIFKNGIEATPSATDVRNEKPSTTPTTMRLSKGNGSISATTILLSYVPIILFLILSVVFLVMAKGQEKTKGFSLPTFGVIWAPVMVLLTGLTKFAPASLTMVFLVASLLAFFGGLGFLGFKMAKAPKKLKVKPEASSM